MFLNRLEENLMPDSPEADERSAVDWGELIELARELPAQLEAAYARERENLHGIHADEHERALNRMIDLLVDMWEARWPAWCTDQGWGRTDPNPVRGQATRTYFGRPRSCMRLST